MLKRAVVWFSLMLWSSMLLIAPAFALPPPEDQPEEVLRTEIILEARSPTNGKLITAAEYAEMQAQIEAQNRSIGAVSPQIRRLIGLLRLRKALRIFFPFIR
jgi:hypothetical protein